jgi:carbon storage regulator
MLVIRRHAGESIWIGDQIEIEVMECGSNRVKLGIRAPKEVPVVREEARLTREQNLAAAHALQAGGLPALVEQLRPSLQIPRGRSDMEE